MAGYSNTPLAKKLGIKSGQALYCKNPPANYTTLLKPLPDNITWAKRLRADLDLIHLFTKERQELSDLLPRLLEKIDPNGMIWVSWPKKASKVKTDITEDTIRAVALPLGLVDVKVCAVDETWSGLKLVIRRENRNA